MALWRGLICGLVVASASVTGLWAQGSYMPGQTFSAGQTATPTPAPVRPQVEQNLPVYAPVQLRPVQQQAVQTRVPTRQVQRPQETQLYNMPDSAPKASIRQQSSSNNAAEKSSSDEKADETGKSGIERTSEASVEREKARETAKVAEAKAETKAEKPSKEATEEPESDSSEATAADDKVVKPESNDKLVFTEHKTGQKLIALTYDDGPNPSFTPRLVEYLKENNVPATFYLCGNMVKEYPDTVKMLAAEGFELANHSYDHPNLQKLSREKVVEQLQDTHDLIKEHTGLDVKTMRPPYGAMNSTVKDVCEAMGYKIILWDVDTEDWRKRSTAQMMNTISKLTGDGSIILMHDRKHAGKETVLETTKQTVEKYRSQGYRFVTVTELLGLNNNQSNSGGTAAAPAVPGPVVPGPLVRSPADSVSTSTAAVLGTSLPAAAAPTQILP